MEKFQDEYEQFIEPIEDQMIQSVWRIVRNPDDAKDAFQEALLKVWKKWDKVRRHPNPHALVLRICINCSYDLLRQKAKYRRMEAIDSIADTVTDPKESPSEKMITQEKKATVFKAISQLPRMQRIAVHMHFIDSFSYSHIAQVFQCDEATIRKHVFRGKNKLRKLLRQLIVEHSYEGETR